MTEIYSTIREKIINMPNLYGGIIDLIGNTPLIKINNLFVDNPDIQIYAKAEFLNPGGSVKDRAAKQIIADAMNTGELNSNKILLDASSGNTAIAYAMICSYFGIKSQLYIPKNASQERIDTLKAYGVQVVLTDPSEGMDGAIKEAKEKYLSNPSLYYYADQYSNQSNWQAHYFTTGQEIIDQTSGNITHFIAGLGTTGTFTGISKRLKDFNPNIKTISFQPDSAFHGIEGIKHLETSEVPSIYDPSYTDEDFRVSTPSAYHMTKELAKKEGLLVGISSGAALVVALEIANHIDEGFIVAIFPDRGDRYLTSNVWR